VCHVIKHVLHVLFGQHSPNPHVSDRCAHYARRKCAGRLMTAAAVDPVPFFAFYDPLLVNFLGRDRCTLLDWFRRFGGRPGKCQGSSADRQSKSYCVQKLHCEGPRGMTKRYVIPTVQMLLLPIPVKVLP